MLTGGQRPGGDRQRGGGRDDGHRQHTDVRKVTFENDLVYSARVWIDASYEGGLVELVATMTWGRESRAQYGETVAGVGHAVSIGAAVNPWWDPHADPYDVPSNIIPHVSGVRPAPVGEADRWVEPFDFRLCFTDSPSNRVNFTAPRYNASEFELWRRIYAMAPPKTLAAAGLACLGPIPNSYGLPGQPARLREVRHAGHEPRHRRHGRELGLPERHQRGAASVWRRHGSLPKGSFGFG